jgi:hypothetical protein
MSRVGTVQDPAALSGDPIIVEALRRYKQCEEWESLARTRFIDDLKFAEGDPDNGYQWPDAIKRARDLDRKPCLTMNLIKQHNFQITNEAKKNKSSVAIRAVGGGATKEAADVYGSVIRRIEYLSNAQAAYSTACDFQVKCGIGWWRLFTDYAGPATFNQEIKIGRVWDPLTVFMDPDIQERDGSDARFAFVFDVLPKDTYDEYYGHYAQEASQQPLGVSTEDSLGTEDDHVRVCEYFRKVQTRDTLISFIDPSDGERKELLRSKMPPEVYSELAKSSMSKTRSTLTDEIQWKLIAGETVIDETVWPGKYIPLIRVIGEESVIEGVMDRKGHTRGMKDSQRMYNYNASSQVEFVALQGKTPWVAAAKAIEEYESMWNSANMINHSVLIYNSVDDQNPDKPIPAPVRQEPPVAAPGYQSGMDTAFNQMMMVSGQYQNSMGAQGNERTGAAINGRQAQAETSVFHFQDNYAESLRNCGKQMIDLIPKVYDVKQTMLIMAEDGTDLEIEINPGAQQAYQQMMNHQGQVVKRIFNPNVGQYEVQADVGASYGTRRREAADSMGLLLTQAPTLTGIIGDLMLDSMDFPKAQGWSRRRPWGKDRPRKSSSCRSRTKRL